MKSRLTTKFVNKYLLPHRSIIFDDQQSFEKFLQKKEDNKPLNTKITTKEYSITKRSKEIRNIIREKKQVNFVELFDEKTKSYVVITFLSILVLSKNNEIKIIQENNFENIMLCEVS